MSVLTPAVIEYRRACSRWTSSRWYSPLNFEQVRYEVRRALELGASDRLSDFVYDRTGVERAIDDLSMYLDSDILSGIDDPVRSIVRNAVEAKIEFAKSCRTDDAEFSRFQEVLHGVPDESTLALSLELLDGVDGESSNVSGSRHPLIGAERAKRSVEFALSSYGLDEWGVVVSGQMAAQVAVNGRRNLVRISSDLHCTEADLDRLLVHEVGGHVLRWENSRRQKDPWLAQPLGVTVRTEEGFALFLELVMGVQSHRQMRVYSARVVAADMAKSLGLIDVARSLSRFIGVRDAVDVAIRVKRGLVDPNGPGGLLKDWGYLGGMRMVHDVISRSPESFDLLAATKWGVELLPQVRSMKCDGLIFAPVFRASAEKLGLSVVSTESQMSM